MTSSNEIIRFVSEWSNQNNKQLREVTEELREIEGAGAAMFTREQLQWGDWRRYHYLKGVKTQRLEVRRHLFEIEAMCKAPGPLCSTEERENLSHHLSAAIAQKSALLNSLDMKCQALKRRRASISHKTTTEIEILDRAAERLEEIYTTLKKAIIAISSVDKPKDKSLEEAVELACKNLPKGWALSLSMECGAAWVTLSELVERVVELEDSTDSSLARQILAATEQAQKMAAAD